MNPKTKKPRHTHQWVYALRSSKIYCTQDCTADYFSERDAYLSSQGIAKGIGAISDYPVPTTLTEPVK